MTTFNIYGKLLGKGREADGSKTPLASTSVIYDDAIEKYQSVINLEIDSFISDQADTNLQITNSISDLSEAKQNRLIAGSNIVIAGNTISAITGGNRSETPIVLYKWVPVDTTPTAPEITAEQYMAGTNLNGWYSTATQRVTGSYLWMTQNTLVYEEETENEGSYSLKGQWSTPIRISGDKGDLGDKGDTGATGPQGPKGDQGDAGEDGSDIEFIYKRSSTYPFDGTNPGNITTDYAGIAHNAQYVLNTDDFVPYGWSDTAIEVTELEKYVYVSIREKQAGTNQTWGAFSAPVLWSVWGAQGIDGDGVQYVYKLFDHQLSSAERTSNIPAKPNSMTNGEWIPDGWYDNPQAPTPEYKFCYCSTIKKIGGVWEDSFGTLGLWSKWASDGTSVAAQYSTTGGNGTWHDGFLIGDVFMRTSSDGGTTWTAGMRIIGEKGDETDFKFGISQYLVTANAYTAPADIDAWNDAPILTNAQKPFLWAKITTPDNVVTYVRLTGEPGDSPIFADLTNEMDAVACNSEGYTIGEQYVETYVSVWEGSHKLGIDAITCRIGNLDLASEYANDDTDKAWNYYKVLSKDLSTGYIKIAIKNGTYISSRTDITIIPIFTIDGNGDSKNVTLTINGVRGGENATIYQLVPSASFIAKKKNGTYVPSTVTCSVIKKTGNSNPQTVTTGFVLKKSVNGGNEVTYSSTNSNTVTSAIAYFLYVNNVLVDKETIPLIEDGSDGIPDVWTIGADGYWYKNGNKYLDANYPNGVLAEGPAGTGIELKGAVETVSDLGSVTGMSFGDCYMVNSNGWLYFYDGTTAAGNGDSTYPANPVGWVPVGEIKGERGDAGTTYYYHIAWATSVTLNNNGVVTEVSGFTTVKGNTNYSWMGICTDTDTNDPGWDANSDNAKLNAAKQYKWNYVEGPQGPQGQKGDTPAALYIWQAANVTSVNAPTVGANDYANGTNLEGWSKTAPNRSSGYEGYNLWMTLRTLEKDSNGAYSFTENVWSTPVRISGDTGTPGEDGDEVEWIYSYSNTGYNGDTGHIGGSGIGSDQNKDQDDWIPNGWSDNPNGVSDSNGTRTEYASWREITNNGTTKTYGPFNTPIIWSHYGERGIDGDGVEYVFVRTKKYIAPEVQSTGNYAENSYDADDHLPYVYIARYDESNNKNEISGRITTIEPKTGSLYTNNIYTQCTDDPVGVTSDWRYEWVLKRTKASADLSTGVRSWNPYSGSASLWAKWSGDIAKLGNDTYRYAIADQGTNPSTVTGWSSTKPSSWGQGEFLWTETTIHWTTDGITEVSNTKLYSAERNPNDGIPGMGVTISSQSVAYCKRTSQASDPSTLTYGNYPSSLSAGDWLYTRTTVNYLDTNGNSLTPTVSYSVSRIGTNGSAGRGISSIVECYKASANATGETAPTSSSSEWGTNPMPSDWNASKPYLWNYEKITYTSGTTVTRTTASVIAVWTKDGAGIDSITNYYLASASGSNITTSSSGWTTTIQTVTGQKPYLWNYEVITYTQGKQSTATSPHIIGYYGRSITNTTIQYQKSSSGTTAPNGTWSNSIPSTNSGEYLWTKITITYSDNTASVAYTVAGHGTNVTAQYSADNSSWHSNYQTGDIWMRTKTGNTWSEGLRIVGEKGDGGDYIDYSFDISQYASTSTVLTKPTDTAAANSWNDGPVATTSSKPYLWMQLVLHTITNGVDTAGTPTYVRITPRDAVIYTLSHSLASSKITIPNGATTHKVTATFNLWSKTGENAPTAANFYLFPYSKDASGNVVWLDHGSSATSSVTFNNYEVINKSCIGVVAFFAFISNTNALTKLSSGDYLAKLEIPVEKEVWTKEDLADSDTVVIGKEDTLNRTYAKITLNSDGVIDLHGERVTITGTGLYVKKNGVELPVVTADSGGFDDVVELLNISTTAPSSASNGDRYYNSSSKKIFRYVENAWQTVSPITPKKDKLYINISNNKTYRWNGSDLVDITPATGEVNQNAYSYVIVGEDQINARYKQDAFELAAGNGVALSLTQPDVVNIGVDPTDINGLKIAKALGNSSNNNTGTVTISPSNTLSNTTTPKLVLQAYSEIALQSMGRPTATFYGSGSNNGIVTFNDLANTSSAGLMSGADKTKLDTLPLTTNANGIVLQSNGITSIVSAGNTTIGSDNNIMLLPSNKAYYGNATANNELVKKGDILLSSSDLSFTKTGSAIKIHNANSSYPVLDLSSYGEVKLSSQSRPTISYTGQPNGSDYSTIATLGEILDRVSDLGYTNDGSNIIIATDSTDTDAGVSIQGTDFVEITNKSGGEGVFIGRNLSGGLADVYLGNDSVEANKVASKGYVDKFTPKVGEITDRPSIVGLPDGYMFLVTDVWSTISGTAQGQQQDSGPLYYVNLTSSGGHPCWFDTHGNCFEDTLLPQRS